jgi:chromosome segregation ATPase
MGYGSFTAVVALVLATGASSACRQQPPAETRETAAQAEAARDSDRRAELQRERDEEIARMTERVAKLETDYASAARDRDAGKATQGLQEELKEDVANVKQAVNDLRTTTPENWWERHEQAMERTTADIAADVQRLAGTVAVAEARREASTDSPVENVNAAPFTSRRDAFVDEVRVKVDAMEKALDNVKASAARKTEVEDTRARVAKLGDDVDRLRSASADDWWDITKARVSEYIDRVEQSVDRLDD